MRQKWIAPIVVVVSVILGAAAYISKPMMEHADTSQPQDAQAVADARELSGPNTAVACVGPADQKVSRATLSDRYHWARTLLDQKLFDAALPNLGYVAAADPGYPGINLDISDTSLHLKYSEQAKAAIKAQLAISDCLAKLPPESLDGYCKSEMPKSTPDGCRAQLSYIGRAAQLQATVVHMELDGRDGSLPVATAQNEPVIHPRPATLNHMSSEPKRATGATHTGARKSSGDRTLIDGEGTDLALGAYSKQ